MFPIMDKINEFHQTFSQHHDLFKTLDVCTVHLFWMDNLRADLQQSFISFLWLIQQPGFSIIQTTNTKYRLKTPRFQINYISATTQTDLQLMSSIYRKVLLPSRHNMICLTQLPILDDFETYFLHDQSYRISIMINISLYTADLVVLSSFKKIYTSITISMSYQQASTKIILYSLSNYKIFLPCTPSIEDCWLYDSLLWLPLTFIDKAANNRKIQNHLFKKLESSMKIWKTNLPDFHNWDPENLCSFTGKRLNYKISLLSTATEDCTKLIIAASINCTSNSCQKILKLSFVYKSVHHPHVWLNHFQYLSPFGCQYHGYRYSIFVNKYSDSKRYLNITAMALLSPFLYVPFLIVVIYLGCILKLTNFQKFPYYWLYATLLEQEDDVRKCINLSNWGLVITWLYCCHLTRSQYTSSIYASMTKYPDPTGIPESFSELVQNSTIKLLSDTRSYYEFYETVSSTLGSKLQFQNYITRLKNQVYWYENSWNHLLSLAYSGVDYQERYLCTQFGGKFILGKRNVNEYFEHSKTKAGKSPEKECTSWNRFAWFYKTIVKTVFGYKFQTSLYSKLVLLMFGDYILIENKEPVVFPELHQWFSRQNTYLMDIFTVKISAIVKSGLYNYQNHYLEIIAQRAALDKFLEENQIDFTWSKFSMVDQIVSKYTPLGWVSSGNSRLSSSFATGNSTTKTNGEIKNFRFIVIIYVIMVIALSGIFCAEVILFKIGLRKIRKGKT